MNQDGFVKDAYEQFLDKVSTYQCPVEDSSYFDEANEYELSMKDLGGIFMWHFITVLLALLISVIKYYRRKRQIQRNNNDDDAISTEIEELDGCDT